MEKYILINLIEYIRLRLRGLAILIRLIKLMQNYLQTLKEKFQQF